eukprot:scaffold1808_cov158-Amphora_coffeaeformis.AAC.10
MTSINKKRTTSSSNTVGSADTHGTTAKRPKIVVSKCIKKDRMRIQAMMDAATAKQSNDDENPTQKYVLLTTESGICKRNTLPELIAAGYIVQRAPPAGHEGSM